MFFEPSIFPTGGHEMNKLHDSLLLAAAFIASIMISSFAWAQEGAVKDSNTLPSGYAIKVERMGGYLGSYSVFWIYPDGQVINALGETGRIPSDIVENWLGTNPPIASPGLVGASVPSSIGSLCFDCSTYAITIYDNAGTRVKGFLFSSADVEKTFPKIVNRLQHLDWSPLMGEPEDPERPSRSLSRPPIKVGGNVQESKLIRRVEPVYPELAERARVQGRVVLIVTVDQQGNVSDIQVTDGHPLLNEAAKAAVRQWKYSPTLLNGEPVPVIATVTLVFSLTESGGTVKYIGSQSESGKDSSKQ